MQKRQAFFYIFIGTNGVGKTHNAKKMFKTNKRMLVLPANKMDPAWQGYKPLKVERKVITDPNDVKQTRQIFKHYSKEMDRFKGVRLFFPDQFDKQKKEFIDIVTDEQNGFNQGLLFVDDYKNYLGTKGSLPAYFRKIFNDRRHRGLDIILASHSLQDVNSDFIQFNPNIVLFKCPTPPNESVLKRMAKPQDLIDTWKRVNKVNQELEKRGKPPRYFEKFKLI